MNTHQEYVDYFTAMVAADKIEYPNPTEQVGRAILAGLREFWGADNWWFKAVLYSFTVTATETQEMPDDFESFRYIAQEDTLEGQRLIYKTPEEFHRITPKVSAYSGGTPQMFTIFRDMDTNKTLIKWYPIPAGGETIKMVFHRDQVTDVAAVPNRYQAGVEAFIAKHVYPFAHPGRHGAAVEAEVVLKKLQAMNKVDGSDMSFMQDETSEQLYTDRPWL